ncbi:MAG: hypothetical protein ACP5VS_14295 [Desulfomonilaceae bacterium]
MKREDMICENCIFMNSNTYTDFCHLKPIIIKESEDSAYIDFPIIYVADLWCGQGEWEGPAKDDPETNVLYRWGEWDK